MSGQIPRPTRSLSLVATLLVWGIGIGLPTNTARADDCLTAPNSPAPEGSHWYYRTDRATQRECWYVRATDQPAQNAAAQATSDAAEKPATASAGTPMSINTDDRTQSLPPVKPQPAPMSCATTDQPVEQSTQNGSPASPVPLASGPQVKPPSSIPEAPTPQVNPASSIPEATAPQGRLWVTTAVGQTPTTGPTADTLPPPWKSCAEQMISVFENEFISPKYDYVENLNDGRGYTAGRVGFATGDVDLLLVVEVYDDMRPNNVLSGFVPILREVQGTVSTRGLEALPAAWKEAASDPLFRQAQDQVSDKLYYIPAMKAADDLHLQSPLAKFALYDAIIQHGAGDDSDSLGGIIRAATRAAGGPPDKAGEKKWLLAFLTARKTVLLNADDPETRATWKELLGRVNEQLRLLKERNLQLASPLTLNPFGTEFTVNCATSSSAPPGEPKNAAR